MTIVPNVPILQAIGIVASSLFTSLLAVPVPIVPKTHLFNAVTISNKGILGMKERIYARKSFLDLGTVHRHKENL